MFQQNLKKVIAIVLVVSMTIGTNGFYTLAQGIENTYDDAVKESINEKNKDYYEEFHAESKIEDYEDVLAEDDDIVFDGESPVEEEADNLENEDIASNDELGSEPTGSDFDVVTPENDAVDNKYEEYEEEPETDAIETENESEKDFDEDKDQETEVEQEKEEEKKTETETEIEIETESSVDENVESKESVEFDETEITIEDEETKNADIVEVSDEVKESVATESATTEIDVLEESETVADVEDIATESEVEVELNEATLSELTDEEYLNSISTESDIKLVKGTESNVKIKTITRYIKATKSVASKSQWTIKEVLMNDQVGSLIRDPGRDGYKDLVADTVKVLLIDQYGNEKVIRVKAEWKFETIDYGMPNKDETLDRLEREFEEISNNNEMAINVDDLDVSKVTTDKTLLKENNKESDIEWVGEVVDSSKNIEEEIVLQKSNKIGSSEEIDETVKEEVENSLNDYSIDNVKYEYVDVYIEDEPTVANDVDKEVEKGIVGNASSTFVKQDRANFEIQAVLDKEKLLKNVAMVLALESDEENDDETKSNENVESFDLTNNAVANIESLSLANEQNDVYDKKESEENFTNTNDALEKIDNETIEFSPEEEAVVKRDGDYEDVPEEIFDEEEIDSTIMGFSGTFTDLPEISNEELNSENFDEKNDDIENNTNDNSEENVDEDKVNVSFDADFSLPRTKLLGSGGTHSKSSHTICGKNSCTGHSDTKISAHTSVKSFNTQWSTEVINDEATYSEIKYIWLSRNVVNIDTKLNFTKDLYLCLNGNTLSFRPNGVINVYGSLYICDCNGKTGQITAYNTKLADADKDKHYVDFTTAKKDGRFRLAEKHMDPKTGQTVEGQGASALFRLLVASGSQTTEKKITLYDLNIKNIMSILPNEQGIELQGSDVDSAAFLYVVNDAKKTGDSYDIEVFNVSATDLWGTQGGLMNAHSVKSFLMYNSTFKGCMAYRGACVNVSFKEGSGTYLDMHNNTIGNTTEKRTTAAFKARTNNDLKGLDWTKTGENTATYGFRPDHLSMDDYEALYLYGNSFAHLFRAQDIVEEYAVSGEGVGSTIEKSYVDVLQNMISPYGVDVPNAMLLFEKVDFKTQVEVMDNKFNYNNTYDNCGVLGIYYLDDKKSSSDDGVAKIYRNEFIGNHDMYKASKDVRAGVGLTINTLNDKEVYVDNLSDGETKPNLRGSVEFIGNSVEKNEAKGQASIISITNVKDVKIDSVDENSTSNTKKEYKNNISANEGGVLSLSYIDNIEIQNIDFNYNYANSKGGALNFYECGNITIGDMTNSQMSFMENVAHSHGGAISIENVGKVNVSNAKFEKNAIASGKYYISMLDNSQINLLKVLSIKNEDYLSYKNYSGAFGSVEEYVGSGGAISFVGDDKRGNDSKLSILDTDFIQNEATTMGGAIYMNTSGGLMEIRGTTLIEDKIPIASRSVFRENKSGKTGGAILLDRTALNLDGVNFTKNKSEQGGAIFTTTHDKNDIVTSETTKVELKNALFEENTYITDADYPSKYQMADDVRGGNKRNGDGTFQYVGNGKFNRTQTEYVQNAGGAIFNFQSKVVINKGTYVVNNHNPIYSVGGEIRTERLIDNHDLIDKKEEDIVFENNTGDYILGHSKLFKTDFYLLGGQIANNDLNEYAHSVKNYTWYDYSLQRFDDRETYVPESYAYYIGGNVGFEDLSLQTTYYDYTGSKTGKVGKYYYDTTKKRDDNLLSTSPIKKNDPQKPADNVLPQLGWILGKKTTGLTWLQLRNPRRNPSYITSLTDDTDDRYWDDTVFKKFNTNTSTFDYYYFNPFLFNDNPDGYVRGTADYYTPDNPINSRFVSQYYYRIKYTNWKEIEEKINAATNTDGSVDFGDMHFDVRPMESEAGYEEQTSQYIGGTNDAKIGQNQYAEYIVGVIRQALNKKYDTTNVPLNDSYEPKAISLHFGGNMTIIKNRRKNMDIEQNIPLEEQAESKVYTISLMKDERLHINAQLGFTPEDSTKVAYQLFGEGFDETSENSGLYTDDWIEGLGDGDVPASIFVNARANDPADGRVIYINDVEDTGHYEIMFEDPSLLLTYKFEMFDKTPSGESRLSKSHDSQYIKYGTKLYNPIGKGTHVYTTNSDARLIDLMGYQTLIDDDDDPAKRFMQFDFSQVINEGDIAQGDIYEQKTIYAIYSRINRPHKVCGLLPDEECNHPNGVKHTEIYGQYNSIDDELTSEKKVIEVSTVSQLLYARWHPEYMYELQDDIIVPDTIWNRPVNGILNNENNPINNLKLCLNGHSITVNGKTVGKNSLFNITGQYCYIVNCQNKNSVITYKKIENVTYPSENITLHQTGVSTRINIIGKTLNGNVATIDGDKVDDGYIVFDGMRTYTARQNLINLGSNNELLMENVKFDDTNNGEGIRGSILDILATAYLKNIIVNNIKHTLSKQPGITEDVQGQGIFRFVDGGSSVIQEVDGLLVKNSSVNKIRTAIIDTFLSNETSSLTIKNSIFDNSSVMDSGVIYVNPENVGYKGKFSLLNSTISNTSFPKGLKDVNGVAIRAKNMLNKFVIDGNTFDANGLKSIASISSTAKVRGGAVALFNAGIDLVADEVIVSNNVFKNNYADLGGGLFLSSMQTVSMDNNKFFGNMAYYGSAIYQIDSTTQNIGKKKISSNSFIKNGYADTKGTYYLQNVSTKDNLSVDFTDITATENIGNGSFLYADYVSAKVPIVFDGVNTFEKNTGGPVIHSTTESNRQEHNPTIYLLGENYIRHNTVGNLYAVYTGSRQTNFAIAGVIDVRFNKDTENRDANFGMMSSTNCNLLQSIDNLPFTLGRDGNGKILATKSYIGFTKEKSTSNVDNEITLFKWNKDTIEDFGIPYLMSQEHFFLDDRQENKSFVVYKAENDYLTIGYERNARKVVANSSEKLVSEQFVYVKYGVSAYLDNFGEPKKDVGYEDYTYKGWITERDDETFVVWDFYEDKFKNIKGKNQSVDAIWATNHGHKVCNTKSNETCIGHPEHGSADEWIIAFNNRFFNTNMTWKYMLTADIVMEEVITEPKAGYAICLNGHTMTKLSKNKLVDITSDDGSFSIVNCQDEGGLIASDVDSNGNFVKSDAQFIYAKGETTSDTKTLDVNIYNVKISYEGSRFMDSGALVSVENVNLAVDGLELLDSCDVSSSLIYAKDSRVDTLNRINMKDKQLDIYNNSSIVYLDNCYSNNQYEYDGETYTGLMLVDNDIKNVDIKREKAFYYINNFTGDINVLGSSIDGIKNANGQGSVFNIKNATGKLNFASTNIARNEGANGSVVYLDYQNTDTASKFTINMKNSIFESNISNNGAAVINADLTDTVANYSLVVNVFDEVKILNNESLAGNGGAINISGEDRVTKSEFNVIGKNVVFRGNSSNGKGGFAYLTDIVYVESENVLMDANVSKAEGGALYLNRVRSTHRGYYRNNKSYGEGAAIYVEGKRVEDDGEQYRDIITFGKSADSRVSDDNDYFFYAYNNLSTHKNYAKHGVITIGAYANMYFSGRIIMRGAKFDGDSIDVPDAIDNISAFESFDDVSNSRNDFVVLYLKTDNTTGKGAKFGYDDAKVERKITELFDYEKSRIHATSDYYDEKVITNYTMQAEYPCNERFFPDQKEKVNMQTGLKEPNNVYFTGTNREAIIHVGVQSRPVYFVLDGGKPVDSYGHTAINPDKIGASGGVKLPKADEIPEVEREGYTFKGWVTNVYKEESPFFTMKSFNPDEDMIYVESDKEYLNIYAVWENNTTNRIEVNYFEQLYYDGDNNGFELMKDIYDYSVFSEVNENNDNGESYARRVGTKMDQIALYLCTQEITATKLYMGGHTITRTVPDAKLFVGDSIEIIGSEEEEIGKLLYENTANPLYKETFISAKTISLKNVSIEGFNIDLNATKYEKAFIEATEKMEVNTVTFQNNQDIRIDLTVNEDSTFNDIKFIQNKSAAIPTNVVTGNSSLINIISIDGGEVQFDGFEFKNNIIDALVYVGKSNADGITMINGEISNNKPFNETATSYGIYVNDSKILTLDNVSINSNSNFRDLIVVDSATLKAVNTEISSNKMISKTLISMLNQNNEQNAKAFEFREVKILENEIYDDQSVGVLIKVTYRNGSDNSILENVNISSNVSQGAIKFVDSNGDLSKPQIDFGENIYIYENRNTSRDNTNLMMKSFTDGNYVNFIDGKVLASTSVIGVNVENITEHIGEVITTMWKDAVHLPDRTTYNTVFLLDVADGCVLYKDGNNIKIAKTNENYLNVVFDLMDEKVKKVIANQRVAEGTVVDLMADPISNAGHSFLGWYYDKNFDTKYEFGDNSSTVADSEHTTIYALWDREVEITVDANNGGYSASDRRVALAPVEAPTTFTYTTKMGSPLSKDVDGNNVSEHIFKREGLYPSGLYTQNGFNQGKNDKSWGEEWDFNATKAGKNTTLYVKWLGATISIAFKPDWIGGEPATFVSGSDEIVSHYDSILTEDLPVVEKTGYTFKGWYTSTTSMVSTTQLTNRMAITYRDDTNAYANWVPAKYVVSFTAEKMNDNSKMSSQVMEYGKKTALKANELKYTGNRLKYWARYDNSGNIIATYSDCEEVINLSTSEEVVLYAIWEADKFEISLNLNDTVGSTRATISTTSVYVEYGKEVGDIPEPTRKGWTFDGWYKTNKFLETDIVESSTTYDWTGLIKLGAVQNSTLYAKWLRNAYKVSFDPNLDAVDGIMEDLNAEFDKKVTIPKNLYKANGYTYLGLESKVKVLVNGVEEEKIFTYNNTAKITIDQYDNFGYIDGIEDGQTITLKATWQEHKYEVEYNANLPEGSVILNGVSEIATASHMYSENWTLATDIPTIYEIDGYEFVGFTDTQDGRNPKVEFGYDNTKAPASYGATTNNGKYVLYAQWIKNPYYIDFLPGGEEVTENDYKVQGTMSRQKLEVDKAANLQNVNTSGNGFTFKGHKFAYWEDMETHATYSNAEEVVNVRTEKDAVAQFKAIWTEYTYSIDYDYNPPTTGAEDGNIVVGEKATFSEIGYGESINIGTADASIKGYEFDSFITPDKKTVIYENDEIKRLAGVSGSGDVVTLKYRWKNKTYKVRFDKNLQGSSQGVNESTWVDTKVYTYDKTFQKGDTSDSGVKGLPNTVVRPGFKFGGWTIEPKTPTDVLTSTDYVKNTFLFRYSEVVEGDDIVLVLYAHWKPLAYTVTLNANSIVGAAGQQDGSFKDLGAIITNNMKLSSKQFDQPIGALATPNLAGYKFTHYTKDVEGNGDIVNPDTLIWPDGTNTRHTIYAQYEPITYSIKFEKGSNEVEGEVGDIQNIKYGDTITLPNITETETGTTYKRRGWTFAGWSYKDKPRQYNKNSNIQDHYDNNAQISNIAEIDGKEVVLVAEWTAHKYTIVFDGNAPVSASGEENKLVGNMTNQDMTYGVEKPLSSNKFSIAGWTFDGWNTESDGSGEHYDDGYGVLFLGGDGYGEAADNEIVTLYAEWKPNEYTINYNVNDSTTGMGTTKARLIRIYPNGNRLGVNSANFTTKFDKEFDLDVLNEYTAERDGYDFIGWGLTKDVLFDERENSIIDGNAVYRTVGDGSVYAMWKNKKYTVSFEVRTRNFRETDQVPNIPPKDVWFDLPYGKVEGISASTDLPIPEIANYQFGSWTLDSWDQALYPTPPENVKVSNTTPLYDLTEDSTLKAWWQGSVNKVTLNANGGKIYDRDNTKTMVDSIETKAMLNMELNSTGYIPNSALNIRLADGLHYEVERMGYTFDGWYTNDTDDGKYVDENNEPIKVTGGTKYWTDEFDVTLYAKWTEVEFTFNYNTNLPTGRTAADLTWEKNADLTEFKFGITYNNGELPIPKLSGYTFNGWNTVKEGNSGRFLQATGWSLESDADWNRLLQSNMKYTIYARWEARNIQITWDSNKASGSTTPVITGAAGETMTRDYRYGASIGNTPTVKRDGYTFDGWYLIKGTEASEHNYDNTSWMNKISDNAIANFNVDQITAYAKWIPDEITVRFNGNDSTSSTKAVLSYATKKIMFDDKVSEQRARGFIKSGVPTQQISAGLPTATKEGYEFVGWFENANGTGLEINNDSIFTLTGGREKVVNLYAKWQAKEYQLIYHKNDDIPDNGSTSANGNTDDMSIAYDSTITGLPTLTRDGYEFRGWWTKNGWNNGNIDAGDWGIRLADNSKFTKAGLGIELNDSGLDIYAKWDRKEISIVYQGNANGDTITFNNGVLDTKAVNYEDKGYFDLKLTQNKNLTTKLPITPSRNGWIFEGWTLENGEDIDINNYTIGSITGNSLVLSAKWSAKEYELVFDVNYVDAMKPVNRTDARQGNLPHSVEAGEVDEPTVTNTNGYTISQGRQFESYNSVEAKIVSKNPNFQDQEGYRFVGWSVKKNGSDDLVGSSVVFNDEVYAKSDNIDEKNNKLTLYAQWEQKEYNISFNKNIEVNGITVTTETMDDITGVKYNELKTLPGNAFSQSGFEFVGWDTEQIRNYNNPTPKYLANINGTIIKPQVSRLGVSGTITLYAVWRVKTYNITYVNESLKTGNRSNMNMSVNTELPTWYNITGQRDRDKNIQTPIRQGYEFLWWKLPNGATTSQVQIRAGEVIDSTGDVTLAAVWNANSYDITFVGNGGVGPNGETSFDSELVTDENYSIPDFGFKRENMLLSHWNTDPNGNGKSLTVRQTISIKTFFANADDYEPQTLYAIWSNSTSGRSVSSGGGRGGSGGGGGGGGGGGASIAASTNGVGFNATTLTQSGGLTQDASGAAAGNWNYDPTTNRWTYTLSSGDVSNSAMGSVVGSVAANGWYKIPAGNGWYGWYSFDNTGNMRTGLYTDTTGNTYYLNTTGVTMGQRVTGWVSITGKEYYFDLATGALKKGSVTPDGYITDATGAKAGIADYNQRVTAGVSTQDYKGRAVEGVWNYDQGSNSWNLQLTNVDSNQSYAARNEWINIMYNGQRQSYRFNEYGVMQTGLITDTDGNVYYLDESNTKGRGAMKSGVVSIGGVSYYFNQQNTAALPYGALARNATLPDGRHTDATGRIID